MAIANCLLNSLLLSPHRLVLKKSTVPVSVKLNEYAFMYF